MMSAVDKRQGRAFEQNDWEESRDVYPFRPKRAGLLALVGQGIGHGAGDGYANDHHQPGEEASAGALLVARVIADLFHFICVGVKWFHLVASNGYRVLPFARMT